MLGKDARDRDDKEMRGAEKSGESTEGGEEGPKEPIPLMCEDPDAYA